MNGLAALCVVGDALLDGDVDGSASRLAPDAPVPVLQELHRRDRPGGAALAAALAARSGARTTLITAIGRDEPGERLRALLAAYEVEVIDLGLSGATPEKIRVCAGGRPLLRMDRDAPARCGRLTTRAAEALGAAPCVLVADYGRGLTASRALRRLLAQQAQGVPVVWDPHRLGRPPVAGCAAVTPNRVEAAAFLDRAPAASRRIAAGHATELRNAWSAAAVLVTLGPEGAVMACRECEPITVPAERVSGDSCGAGDALSVAMASALGRGVPTQRAAAVAVHSASEFVAAGGAAAVQARPPSRSRVSDAQAMAGRVRERGGKVVATGGCFDLLHTGHLTVLEAARRLGDCLIVCVNSDESVRRLKGADRPLVSEDDRVAVLRSVRWVDAVEVFAESTPDALLRRLRPDVWVKGGDYAGSDLPERDVLAEWGGEVAIVPYRSGRSTTRLLALARMSA
jgi:rfaE bifunctional protein nucleotidyltransferase chain/domain/rfaE bifunctional protein kinase chain/domain